MYSSTQLSIYKKCGLKSNLKPEKRYNLYYDGILIESDKLIKEIIILREEYRKKEILNFKLFKIKLKK